jgi:exodeoxyribonuclease V gamma subunit
MTSDVILPVRSSEPEVVEKTEPVLLKSLVDFWRDPLKWYVNKNLQIYYRDEEILLPDKEAFEVDHLKNWALKNALLFRGDTAVKEIIRAQKREGYLPLRNLGEYFVNEAFKETKAAGETLRQLTDQRSERILEINLLINGLVVAGKVNHVFGERMVVASVSGSNPSRTKNFCAAIVEYLAAVASGEELEFYFIDSDGSVGAQLGAGVLDAATAKKELTYIVAAFKSGHQHCFPFLPSLYVDLFGKAGYSPADLISKIQTDLEKTKNQELKPVHEPYFKLLWDSKYFTEQTCAEIQTEVNHFFGWINSLMPGAFTIKEKKKNEAV